ncbi:hypothetical protein O181_078588 [Austropuccinia psidii MF-1]|uniref:Retrotransposon gag domain-containing protein n=1 Tax=Austropuccinia psidii MF-1 TaxID=1389203 RepID=A0A9Q3FJ92_9BASI|nr:hypothetical protein [Austropuccinia psidii MF-1]
MNIQHSPPARQKKSQARTQAALTQTPRAPLDITPAVPKLRAHLDRGPNVEREAPSRKGGRVPRRSSSFSGVVGGFPGPSRTTLKGPGEDGEEEEENSVEEEKSDGTEGVPAPVGHHKQMTQITANLQAASSSEASRPTAFKTPSMKEPECFTGTQPFKVRSFPYLSNLTNQDSNYLLNYWNLFEYQLFTLFEDPNEVRKAEAELDSQIMKEDSHVSLYIADFRILVSRIGDGSERALIHHFRKGFLSRILD